MHQNQVLVHHAPKSSIGTYFFVDEKDVVLHFRQSETQEEFNRISIEQGYAKCPVDTVSYRKELTEKYLHVVNLDVVFKGIISAYRIEALTDSAKKLKKAIIHKYSLSLWDWDWGHTVTHLKILKEQIKAIDTLIDKKKGVKITQDDLMWLHKTLRSDLFSKSPEELAEVRTEWIAERDELPERANRLHAMKKRNVDELEEERAEVRTKLKAEQDELT
eukprot:CAMPEP_0113849346 /NCGR_PEP_ID=MMETSP0372-20130328/3077_1 /TAXON_ID=340204 /ORGANISM="Lankesteria abbotti" /LENGTH=217 /DNA_ID=CAMNT_0000819121 /DNA_START=767 /DNA_END=1417 /DNA_ORIENTATION=+ /assembly_acc=CAM_ASM_000359